MATSMTKMEKATASAKGQVAKIRANASENQADWLRKGAGLAASFALGKATATGDILKIPTFWGIPRTLLVSGVFNAIGFAMNRRSKWKIAFDGIGESTLYVAGFQYGAGQSVAGDAEAAHNAVAAAVDIEGRRRRRAASSRKLETRIRAELDKQLGQGGRGSAREETESEYEDDVDVYDAAA